MKFIYAAAPLAMAQAATGYTMYDISPRGSFSSIIRRPTIKVQRDFSCSDDDMHSEEKESVHKAFKDLAEEFGSERRPYGPPRRRNRQYAERRGPPNPYQSQNAEERKAFIRKQREWIDKAFDLASDLNENLGSSTPNESKRNEEDLQNVREWVNAFLGNAEVDRTNPASTASSSSNSPRYEVQTTDEAFQVSLDVPGVDKSDIDIQLSDDDMVLTVSGTRRALSSNKTPVTFSKNFVLDETIDVDKISANLEMGVLLITAPKKMPKEEEPKKGKRIPVM